VSRRAHCLAWQRVCSGSEMASSSTVSAGYLARRIGCSRLAGSVAAPPPSTTTCVPSSELPRPPSSMVHGSPIGLLGWVESRWRAQPYGRQASCHARGVGEGYIRDTVVGNPRAVGLGGQPHASLLERGEHLGLEHERFPVGPPGFGLGLRLGLESRSGSGVFQSRDYQRSLDVMSPAKQLITVGRLATPRPPARLIW